MTDIKVKTGTANVALTCTVTGITTGTTMEASWYDGATEITDSSQGEYSARKLQLDDILKLIILRDERLIVLRWC